MSLSVTGLAGLILLVTSTGAAAGPTPCRLLVPFDPESNFADSTRIDNTYLPRPVGMEWILEKESGGFIVTRITAMTKTIKFGPHEVKARVIWELDLESAGVTVKEEELRFEAQDDSGTVSNFGELPLETDDEGNPTFENTWIAGFGDALAGHAMLGHPEDKKTHKNKEYLQALAVKS